MTRIERHFTVAVFVVWQERVLLHRHAKLGMWLPPGGHIEPDELPDDAAVREVEEEYAIPPEGQEAPVWSAEVTRLPLSRPYSPRAPKLRTDADEGRGRRYEEPKYALSRR